MSRMGCRRRWSASPEDVPFPVTPMLDMAFQLLAFFILTFQAPSAESRLDLYLPAAPVALPSAPGGQAQAPTRVRSDLDLETDILVRARANDLGDLQVLKLGEAELPDHRALGDRLRRYAVLLEGKPMRVLLQADDSLRYEVAARLIGTCASAGAAAVRLADPAGPTPTPTGPRP